MLSETYGEEATEKPSVFKWHKKFKESHKNMDDNERSGSLRSHRTNENVEKVQNLVHSDRCSSIRALVVQLNLDKEMVKKA
jgi:hypothetical protein